MRINEYIKSTEINGPGTRFCLWMQGCARGCEGCFNPEVCTFDGGFDMSIDDIVALIKESKNKRVSISGGEPFAQAQELYLLLRILKEERFNILVFSGFVYEELKLKYPHILKLIDYLIDGPYMKDVPARFKYAGSGNQRFLKLNNGEIEEDLSNLSEYKCGNYLESEIIISENSVKVTGFPGFKLK